jgi:hypothetical protein
MISHSLFRISFFDLVPLGLILTMRKAIDKKRNCLIGLTYCRRVR